MPFDVYFIDKCNEITAIHPTYGSANVGISFNGNEGNLSFWQ